MNFAVKPGSIGAFQTQPSRSLFSNSSNYSNNSNNTLGYQTMLFEHSLSLSFPTCGASPQVVSVDIGSVPLNCLVFSAVCYSESLTGIGVNGNTLITGNTVNSNLTMTVNSLTNTGTNTILNNSLAYPNFVSGEFNPQSSTSPFISILRDSAVSASLRLTFSYIPSTEELNTLTGDIIVKVSLQQMDPNNTTADGYPTGGIAAGPVRGSNSL